MIVGRLWDEYVSVCAHCFDECNTFIEVMCVHSKNINPGSRDIEGKFFGWPQHFPVLDGQRSADAVWDHQPTILSEKDKERGRLHFNINR